MIVDKDYCMSSFLMHRTIIDRNRTFSEGISPSYFVVDYRRELVHDADELGGALKEYTRVATNNRKVALFLSGGVDSAILARYMPKGSVAYTFRCVVPGVDVIDETPYAAKYAEICGLEHRVVEVYWEDFEKYTPVLMERKGAPIHSIEVQIYKACLQAIQDGIECVVMGEAADCNYGGQDGLLSRDWTLEEYTKRYSYVDPRVVLRSPQLITQPFEDCCVNGKVDVFKHLRTWYFLESCGSYHNACCAAGIDYIMPYSRTWLDVPLDLERVRSGDTKYLVRELFRKEYSGLVSDNEIKTGGRKKIPMPRPMNEWMQNWEGPQREEFLPGCVKGLSGDQKWMLYSLEKFLNMIES